MRPLRERGHSLGKEGSMILFFHSERSGAKRNGVEELSLS
jgi:hypothetical protein